jgi:hypothetical protein
LREFTLGFAALEDVQERERAERGGDCDWYDYRLQLQVVSDQVVDVRCKGGRLLDQCQPENPRVALRSARAVQVENG